MVYTQYPQVSLSLESEKAIERKFGNLLSIHDNYPKHLILYEGLSQSNHQGVLVWNIQYFLEHFRLQGLKVWAKFRRIKENFWE